MSSKGEQRNNTSGPTTAPAIQEPARDVNAPARRHGDGSVRSAPLNNEVVRPPHLGGAP